MDLGSVLTFLSFSYPLRPLGSGGAGRRGTQAHLTAVLSADSESSYSLSCGVPALQARAPQRRNGTSSSPGPRCSGSPWPVRATLTWVTL